MNTFNILNEPQKEWGGTWTDKKLIAFAKYVSAYLKIMKSNSYWKTIYFDGFAGCGERKSEFPTLIYQQLSITESEERVYKGSAERVLAMEDGSSFDFYYFIDKDKESLNKLEVKISKYQESKSNPFQFKYGDCNRWIIELANALKQNRNKYAALVFLDPFGMQIDWESIEALKNTRTDIWILVPTGVIVNRLLDRNGELTHLQKLQSFFGLSEQEIREFFYTKTVDSTLFGDEEKIRKITKPIEQIAMLYVQRLKTIWTYVTERPLSLNNSRNVPIFHLIFASNNAAGVKIASQIIKSV